MVKNISFKDWFLNILFIAVPMAFGFFVWRDIQIKNEKTMAVPDGAIELAFPLSGGRFYVAFAGRGESIYGPIHTTAAAKYALDIVKDNGNSDIFGQQGTDPAADPSFGTPVSSPCSGRVVSVQNNMPDLLVGNRDYFAVANGVTIECDAGFTVVLVHFKQGSVVVNIDDRVNAGDSIAAVGNSGNTTGPHLHIAAFRGGPDDPVKTPLPMIFGGRYLQKGDTVTN